MRRIWTWSAGLAALALTVGVVWACGSSSSSDSPTQPGSRIVTVTIDDDFFDPRSITINAGDTVRWVFQGSDPTHTVTERDEAWDTGFIFQSTGDSYERTFTAADNNKTFEYSCRSHKDCCEMQGSIRVGQSAPPPAPGY